jgi:hypothetical protein
MVDTLIKSPEPEAETLRNHEGPDGGVGRSEIRIKGKTIAAPSVQIDGRVVVTTGNWLKMARVRDEELVEGDTIANPESVVSELKKSGFKADVFTFAQRVPESTPKYNYRIEWENAAAVHITTFARWLKEDVEHSIRKGVNRAEKLGVVVKEVEFTDELVEAICSIYNEVPVRQGKTFWHYGKDFRSIKDALATYLERSVFLGAYYQDALIGFIKMTWVGDTGTLTQILSMKQHFDKRPNNAMIAKAIQMCEAEGKSHFIYGSYVYYDPSSSLTEFKRRSGFKAVPLPRYYVPLTIKGRLALTIGLHRGVAANTPKPLLRLFLKARKMWSEKKLKDTSKSH